jgi:hypothetical protein
VTINANILEVVEAIIHSALFFSQRDIHPHLPTLDALYLASGISAISSIPRKT